MLSVWAQDFAKICGFCNPENHKPHKKRALGITMLSNSNCSTATKLKAARHSDPKTHARYQRDTAVNQDRRQEAMNPSLLAKKKSGKEALH